MDDLSLRDLLQLLTRYRVMVVGVAALLALSLLAPGTRQADDRVTATADPVGGIATVAPDVSPSDPGSVEALGDTTGSNANPTGAAPGARSSAGVTPAGAPARTGGAVVGGGLSSPSAASSTPVAANAASAPDCDPATGRLRLPTANNLYPPNCVPVWPDGADNGGDTWRGVTKDAITIAIYEAQDNAAVSAITTSAGAADETSDEEDDQNRNKVIEAFQAHYETYGRKVKWVKIKGSGASDDDAAARADAVKVATEIKAFASIGDPSQAAGATAGGTNAYIEELAARGVLCVACTQTQPQRNFASWAPHAWGQRISADQLYLHVAEYIGKGLGTSNAKWSGDPLMQSQPRTYGLLQYNTPDNSYAGSADFLDKALRAYGVGLTATVEYTLDVAQGQEIARTVIARMKDKGVNTVICYCDPLMPIFFTQEATRQRYLPEWIVTGSLATDTALFGRLYDQAQWAHAHGVSLLPARVDPDAIEGEAGLAEWHHGASLSSSPNQFALGMLFTGIHLAGPRLTPATFRDGMFSFKPASGSITRVATSFGPGLTPWDDYHALDDTTDIWWDADAQGPDELGAEATGLYRYVDRGRRYLLDQRPRRAARAFDEANTVMIYPSRPPEDATPSYPHEHHR